MKNLSIVSLKMPIIAGGLVIAIGLLGMAGWVFDSYALRSFYSDGATMKFNTALLIIGSGALLLTLPRKKQSPALVLLSVLFLFSFFIIAENLFSVDLGIDQWLVKDGDTHSPGEHPGRTSLLTALSLFVLYAAVLAAIARKNKISQLIAGVMFVLLYAVVLGHLFDEKAFYQNGKYSGMALHTSMALIIFSAGLLFYEVQKGFMKVFMFSVSGRTGIFYLGIYILAAAPLTVAIYQLLVTNIFLNALSAILTIVIFSSVISIPIMYAILKLIGNYTDDLNMADQRLGVALQAAELGCYELDLVSGEMICDTQFKANFGLSPYESLSYNDTLAAIDPAQVKKAQLLMSDAVASHQRYHGEFRISWPDNTNHWIAISGIPRYDAENKAIAMTGVVSDITFRKEAEASKDAFIGIASHELKTPLTTLKGYVQLLESKAAAENDAFNVTTLKKIDSQVNKLTNMINSFLHISRPDANILTINKHSFLLNTVINEFITASKEKHPGRHILFQPQVQLYVRADKDKILQVIEQLTSNAMRYSDANSTIEIVVTKEKKQVVVGVIDKGIGISSRELPYIFERFYRVNNKENKYNTGFGIGLYLSAEIIHLHEGNIWAESNRGKGSVFYFTLPQV